MKRYFVGVLCLLILALPAAAQDGGIVTDENALFGGGGDSDDGELSGSESSTSSGDSSAVDEESLFGSPSAGTTTDSSTESDADGFIQEVESVSGNESTLLTSEMALIGGRYRFSSQNTWSWNDPSTVFESIDTPDSNAGSVDLSSTLYVDARPSSDFRVFAKGTVSYPFDDEDGARTFNQVFTVEELFSDFTWNDYLFFRGGKHTVNWGVGYFFSPADLLNLTEIDPENPDAEREGPVSLKVQAPINVHNLYIYLTANNIDAWNDIGVAAKSEFVLGPAELGIGGLYQKDVSPSAMMTVTFPLWDIDFYGEAVVRYGSERVFVEESETALLGVEAVAYDDTLFYHATAGFSFIYTFSESDSSIMASGQYLYNGEGYEDPTVLQEAGVGGLLVSGDISPADLRNTGRHYAAANASWNKILGSGFTLGSFWIHNFNDESGYLSPSLSFNVFDGLDIALSTPFGYGEEGDEYTPFGDSLSAKITMRLGNGSF